jgi:hypothetical protein
MDVCPPVGVLCLQLNQGSRLKLQVLDAVVVINHVLPDDKVKIFSDGLNELVTLMVLDYGRHTDTYTPPDYQEVFMPGIPIVEDDFSLGVALDYHLSECILQDSLLMGTALFVLLLILVSPYGLQRIGARVKIHIKDCRTLPKKDCSTPISDPALSAGCLLSIPAITYMEEI